MIRTLIYFAQVAVLVAAGLWLSDNPGELRVDWLGYRIETYFALLLVAVALLVVLAIGFYKFWRGILGAPGSWLSHRAVKRRESGYKALTLGMAAVAAGDPDEAKRQAKRADELLRQPALTRLLSAQAASLNGDTAAAARYFEALTQNAETEFLGVTGLMRLAIQQGDTDEVRSHAERARKLKPGSPYVVETLFQLQTEARDWSAALETLSGTENRRAFADATKRSHRAALMTERARAAETAGHLAEAIKIADRALEASPHFVPAIATKARLLMSEGKPKRAARLLEDEWRHVPHPDLAAGYRAIWGEEDALQTMKRMQRLTGSNSDNLASHLALADAALRADLWGAARNHLEHVGVEQRTAAYHRLQARLAEAEHGDVEAARAALEAATSAPPEEGWSCSSCGATVGDWGAVCDNCNSFDTIVWKRPPRVSVLRQAVPGEPLAAEPGSAEPNTADPNTADPNTAGPQVALIEAEDVPAVRSGN
ncbi:MAG: heme biosynthesis protein HemY [Rhodospirillaceae bacterium]|nr:heme biosynthesis protein HemY [Rhodospirillaceae bacterium]